MGSQGHWLCVSIVATVHLRNICYLYHQTVFSKPPFFTLMTAETQAALLSGIMAQRLFLLCQAVKLIDWVSV